MEIDVKLLEAINLEVNESKKTLEDLANKVLTLQDSVLPMLTRMVESIRTKLMAVTTEFREVLKLGEEVRNFFSDKNYTDEIREIERFLVTCERFQSLKQNGSLDIFIDTAIKLSEKVKGDQR